MGYDRQVKTQRLTASGNIGSGDKTVRIFSVSLLSGGTLSTCSIKSSGAGGSIYDQIDGTASKSVTKNYAGGLVIPTVAYFTADANITSAVITYAEGDNV